MRGMRRRAPAQEGSDNNIRAGEREASYIWPNVIVTTFSGRSVACTAKQTIVNGSARQ